MRLWIVLRCVFHYQLLDPWIPQFASILYVTILLLFIIHSYRIYGNTWIKLHAHLALNRCYLYIRSGKEANMWYVVNKQPHVEITLLQSPICSCNKAIKYSVSQLLYTLGAPCTYSVVTVMLLIQATSCSWSHKMQEHTLSTCLTIVRFASVGKLLSRCPLSAALPKYLPPHHQGTDQLQLHCWSHSLQDSLFPLQSGLEWQTLCKLIGITILDHQCI